MDEAGRVGMQKRGEAKEDTGEEEKVQEDVLESVKKGLKRFLKDLTTPRLFVLKLIYFSIIAGK